ncbi:MAG: rhodanese-like domain-containing protein [Ferruginibacter sp.]
MLDLETQACFAIKDLRALQAQAAEQLTIIDVRNPDEYAAVHIPGAINIPLPELIVRSKELSKKNMIVTACGKGGGRSAQGAAILKQTGFNRANYLCGGTFGWFEVL